MVITNLLLDGGSTEFRDVHEVEYCSSQVGEGRDGLHLNRVAVLQRVVKYAGCVDHLHTTTKYQSVRHYVISSGRSLSPRQLKPTSDDR